MPLLRPLPHYEPPVGLTEPPSWPLSIPQPRQCPPSVRPAGVNAHRLVNLALEVLDGRRPSSHLSGLVTHRVLLKVRGRVQPHSTKLRRVYTCALSARAVEITATVSRGDRVLAVAARAQLYRGTWRLTEFDLL